MIALKGEEVRPGLKNPGIHTGASLAEISDPTWQQTSPLAAALAVARRHGTDPDVRLAAAYFEKTFTTHGDRLQASLRIRGPAEQLTLTFEDALVTIDGSGLRSLMEHLLAGQVKAIRPGRFEACCVEHLHLVDA